MSDSGYRTYIITARRITSGELFKQWNGFHIPEGHKPSLSVSSQIGLTPAL